MRKPEDDEELFGAAAEEMEAEAPGDGVLGETENEGGRKPSPPTPSAEGSVGDADAE